MFYSLLLGHRFVLVYGLVGLHYSSNSRSLEAEDGSVNTGIVENLGGHPPFSVSSMELKVPFGFAQGRLSTPHDHSLSRLILIRSGMTVLWRSIQSRCIPVRKKVIYPVKDFAHHAVPLDN